MSLEELVVESTALCCSVQPQPAQGAGLTKENQIKAHHKITACFSVKFYFYFPGPGLQVSLRAVLSRAPRGLRVPSRGTGTGSSETQGRSVSHGAFLKADEKLGNMKC